MNILILATAAFAYEGDQPACRLGERLMQGGVDGQAYCMPEGQHADGECGPMYLAVGGPWTSCVNSAQEADELCSNEMWAVWSGARYDCSPGAPPQVMVCEGQRLLFETEESEFVCRTFGDLEESCDVGLHLVRDPGGLWYCDLDMGWEDDEACPECQTGWEQGDPSGGEGWGQGPGDDGAPDQQDDPAVTDPDDDVDQEPITEPDQGPIGHDPTFGKSNTGMMRR